ncbi:hypothetical protein HCJ39_13355 [Listeria rocourtiae]|uniref:hypothetical protein n=1 Tax=Listeria rocourtiae TaxID=647910 RepID=UPI00162A6631|nr:hypothetical protein [Listeria rocourtiae]MBC1605702.1 hypothetical protein [Listeria rocourtiae]
MKKGIGVLLLGLVLLLAACGDEESSSVKDANIKNPFKNSTFQADEFGKAVLSGKVSSGAKVALESKPVKVNKDGSFKITLENYEDEEAYYSVEVNEKNKHWNSFMVTVTPNKEYLANIEADETAAENEQKKLARDAETALSKAERTIKREDLNTADNLISKVGAGYLGNFLERRDALEKKVLAKDEQDEKINAQANTSKITFNMLNKNADKYVYESYYIKGKVIQAIENDGTTLLRVDMTKTEYGWEDTVAVIYDNVTDAVEDDIVEVYGIIHGNYSYDTTIGGSATIPGITATSITVVK